MYSWSRSSVSGVDVLDAAEICDLLKGVVLISCCVVMHYVDVSMMYHIIRGQTVIKLYIFFNMLDVCLSVCLSVCHIICGQTVIKLYIFFNMLDVRTYVCLSVSLSPSYNCTVFTPCPRKKQATLIFAITSPSVEIFLQFLKHFVQE